MKPGAMYDRRRAVRPNAKRSPIPRSAWSTASLLVCCLALFAPACGDRRQSVTPAVWALVASEPQSINHSQGLASAPELGDDALVFSSAFTLDRSDGSGHTISAPSIRGGLAMLHYDHLGDIDAYGSLLYGPIEDNLPPFGARPHRAFALYDVQSLALLTFADDPGDPNHPADGDNSWVAISPDGAVLLTSEWSPQRSLITYATSDLAAGGNVRMTGEIPLDRSIDRVQGCDFDGPRRLLCASDDPEVGRPLYQIDLDGDLAGGVVPSTLHASVTTLFPAPVPMGECSASPEVEVEGVDVEGDTLRLIVLGPCPLTSTLYTYQRER
jgi:hypothetical protein